MSDEFLHPAVSTVLEIHEEVLLQNGGSDGIRSMELLESALAAPRATMMGTPLIHDPVEICAAYFYYLCINHPFVDGNKRVALATCLVCLSENHLLVGRKLNRQEWEALTLRVAASEIDRAELTIELRRLI